MAVKKYQKGQNEKLSNNFRTYEFDCKGQNCCSTTYIDEKLVEYLQQIRNHFNKPLTISSAYRCAIHNSRVGGVSSSQHTYGSAADFSVEGVAPKEVAKYAESIGVLGIGLYESDKDGYFVHIDTRTTKSFWYGQAQAYRATFGGTKTSSTTTTTTTTVIQQQRLDKDDFSDLMNEWIAEQARKAPDTWSSGSRAWAEKNGLIKGDDNNKMYKKFLTREEMIEVLYRALHRNFID